MDEVKIPRFDLNQDSNGWELGPAYMDEQPDGDYVRYEAIAALEAQVAALTEHNNDYVAWLRWSGDETHRHFVICDSDAEDAFRVYRRPLNVQDQERMIEQWNQTNNERNALIERLTEQVRVLSQPVTNAEYSNDAFGVVSKSVRKGINKLIAARSAAGKEGEDAASDSI